MPAPGTVHYCHNCGYSQSLRDGVHCGWCLDFFYENGRMPKKGDQRRTVSEKLFYALSRDATA